jgi:Protein of unknown function (DUF1570)
VVKSGNQDLPLLLQPRHCVLKHPSAHSQRNVQCLRADGAAKIRLTHAERHKIICLPRGNEQFSTPTMALETRRFRWRLKARETRLLIYLLVLLGVVAWKFMARPWHPSLTLEVPHHIIYSTATRLQTEETAQAMGLLYSAYSNRLGSLSQFQPSHPKLRVKLFKDRAELRRVNPGLGWAEAFYRKPYCLAYYSANEINPCHWMLHEAVHQLNHEVAHLSLEHWLEEGLAEYFSTSRLTPDGLAVGRIDPNAYPVWWIDDIATSPDLAENLRNGSVIPLRCILTDHGGPSRNSQFNLYYLHWWTLTYFVFESPQHRERALALVQRGGGLDAFEQLIGPVETVQPEWHAYVRRLKAALAGSDLEFFKKAKGTAGDGNR